MQKSSFPYLVDISLGDRCPFGCPFCYTSSTKQGDYADYNVLYLISKVLFESNVFNVVFGGGEPTLYEKNRHSFLEVLEIFKQKDFVVGVTTKNYNYHKKPTFKEEMGYIDSIAVSCQTIDELEKTTTINQNLGLNTKLYIQTILGLNEWDFFKKFINKVSELGYSNVTILGYKNYGFGTKTPPHEIPDDWMSFVRDSGLNVGVDSVIVNKYREKLKQLNVPEYVLVGKEGLSSCYIDALKKVIKPSSFCDIEYHLIDPKSKNIYAFNKDKFLDIFSRF
jgi:organic radical activating enzyme